MNDTNIQDIPKIYGDLQRKSKEVGFNMPSDLYTGTLLKTLVSSKPSANILELGTGIGLSLSWMIDGMDEKSRLTTVDNDFRLTEIAGSYFGNDNRVDIVCEDGEQWIHGYTGDKFDLIFADAWPGKYGQIEEILNLLKTGGFYVIDDMSEQPNWPEGHQENVDGLIKYLEKREDLVLTKLDWSTGVVVVVKK
ncbi:class I SAM-dependent methyltransferase [Maribacter sp. MMG018]|uniref:O-methyltransferase n=1 Tax=Maribacter sp. MMG018 TaxID=2822688 RepID=UPI001B3855D3|nr:class I SAM-dependent methyltransferase [Maribacter sp. MMG018]MBQ4915399.1 class I SAM-dependent methyltransferase [Maribacter sp. MMG018]